VARSFRTRYVVAFALGAALLVPALAAGTASAKPKHKTFVVCKHGCKYRTIQSAVDKAHKGDTVRVKPGKYVEGVLVRGSRRDGLRIIGTGKKPGAVVLEGKNAKTSDGSLANHGIEGDGADHLVIKNLKVTHYVANGVYLHGSSDTARTACHGFLMKDLVAAFNRSYGLFAFNCTGGRITRSVGYGHGDSAWYIGATPPQKKPKWTQIDHTRAYRNVLGYSGTNSRYVNIHHNDFYNNGAGVVPNTLDSEPYEPTANGIIRDNNIFWNNFNYFLPASNVETVSGGLGEVGDDCPDGPGCQELNYPIGIGVILFGADGWVVKNNNIFGNFKWGASAFSDPLGNEGDDAVSRDNRFFGNKVGRNGTDLNGTSIAGADFFVDGSGSGNCFGDNGASATYDPSATHSQEFLYPSCPAPPPPASGTGISFGDFEQQLQGDLINYVASPKNIPGEGPEDMECDWTKHPHPPFKGYKPVNITPGPTC
jgi:hypothetical protein